MKFLSLFKPRTRYSSLPDDLSELIGMTKDEIWEKYKNVSSYTQISPKYKNYLQIKTKKNPVICELDLKGIFCIKAYYSNKNNPPFSQIVGY